MQPSTSFYREVINDSFSNSKAEKLYTEPILLKKRITRHHSKYLINQPTLLVNLLKIMSGDKVAILIVVTKDIVGNISRQSVCIKLTDKNLPDLKVGTLLPNNIVTIKVPNCDPFIAFVAALSSDTKSVGNEFNEFLKNCPPSLGFDEAKYVKHYFPIKGIKIEASTNQELVPIPIHKFDKIVTNVKAEVFLSKEKARSQSNLKDATDKPTSADLQRSNRVQDTRKEEKIKKELQRQTTSTSSSVKKDEILVANMNPNFLPSKERRLTRRARQELEKNQDALIFLDSPKDKQAKNFKSTAFYKKSPDTSSTPSSVQKPGMEKRTTSLEHKSRSSKVDKLGKTAHYGKDLDGNISEKGKALYRTFTLKKPYNKDGEKLYSRKRKIIGDSDKKITPWGSRKIAGVRKSLIAIEENHANLEEIVHKIENKQTREALKLIIDTQTELVGIIAQGGIRQVPEIDSTYKSTDKIVTYLEGILPLETEKYEFALSIINDTLKRKAINAYFVLSRFVRFAFPTHWIRGTTLVGSSGKNSLTQLLGYPDPLKYPGEGEFDEDRGYERIVALFYACCRVVNIREFDYKFEKEMRNKLIKALFHARSSLPSDDVKQIVSSESESDISIVVESPFCKEKMQSTRILAKGRQNNTPNKATSYSVGENSSQEKENEEVVDQELQTKNNVSPMSQFPPSKRKRRNLYIQEENSSDQEDEEFSSSKESVTRSKKNSISLEDIPDCTNKTRNDYPIVHQDTGEISDSFINIENDENDVELSNDDDDDGVNILNELNAISENCNHNYPKISDNMNLRNFDNSSAKTPPHSQVYSRSPQPSQLVKPSDAQEERMTPTIDSNAAKSSTIMTPTSSITSPSPIKRIRISSSQVLHSVFSLANSDLSSIRNSNRQNRSVSNSPIHGTNSFMSSTSTISASSPRANKISISSQKSVQNQFEAPREASDSKEY